MRTLICYLNKNVISIKGAYMYKPRTEWSRPQHPWGPGGDAASAAQGAGVPPRQLQGPAVRTTAWRAFFQNYKVPLSFTKSGFSHSIQNDSGSRVPIS